jgi:hypothetical protein
VAVVNAHDLALLCHIFRFQRLFRVIGQSMSFAIRENVGDLLTQVDRDLALLSYNLMNLFLTLGCIFGRFLSV